MQKSNIAAVIAITARSLGLGACISLAGLPACSSPPEVTSVVDTIPPIEHPAAFEVPSSDETRQSVGVYTWAFHGEGLATSIIGQDASGAAVASMTIQVSQDETGAPAVDLETLQPSWGHLRLGRDGHVIVREGDLTSVKWLRAMLADLKRSGYGTTDEGELGLHPEKIDGLGWGCAIAIAEEALTCAAATAEVGANPIADYACVVSAINAIHVCSAD